MRTRVLLLASIALLTAVLSACGSDDGRPAAATKSVAVETSDPAVLATADTEPPAPASVAPVTWPVAITDVTQGSSVWAVYLAVDDNEGAYRGSFSEVTTHVRSLGYGDAVEGRELGCAAGASEALGRGESDIGVALFFDTRELAEQFIALYDRPYAGYAQVIVECSSPWAVYLAVEPDLGDEMDFAKLGAIAEHARSLGPYEVFSGNLGCDLGAPDTLGLEGDLLTVVTYFNTREQAEEFVAFYGRPVVAYAKIGMAPCAE